MLCRYPYMIGTLPCPCGGCLPCRIARRRVWAHRIMLESFKHGDSCFVTLTFDEQHLVEGHAAVRDTYQRFLKRLRRLLSPRKVRFFLASEYGEETGRLHFHAALFGLDSFTAGGVDGRGGVVAQAWGQGHTFVGELTWASAQYIAGYLTKKASDGVRAGFSRMSLRPGIGAGSMADVARSLATDSGLDSVVQNLDVPSVLQYNKRLLPLGRYLRRRLRGELGFVSKDTPSEFVRLYGMLEAAKVSESRSQLSKEGLAPWDVQKRILDIREQKIKNLESRFGVKDSKRKTLK